jgi:hypothetical protein
MGYFERDAEGYVLEEVISGGFSMFLKFDVFYADLDSPIPNELF